MKNFVQFDNSVQLAAPSGGVTGGSIYRFASLVGVALSTVAEGENFTFVLRGLVSGLPKAASETWAIGDPLYLKADGSSLTKTSSSNFFAGYAMSVQGSSDTTGDLLLAR